MTSEAAVERTGEREHYVSSLYAAHAQRMRRMLARRGIRSEDLDDVLQETFVTVHRRLPDFEGRSSIETWLYGIAWRVASNFQRRKRNHEVMSIRAEDSIVAEPAVEPTTRSIHKDLRRLDEEQRDVVALHEVAGFKISEISSLTGQARATIRARLERGRTALQRRVSTVLAHAESDGWPAGTEPALAARLMEPNRTLIHDVVRDEIVISTLDNIVIALWRGDASDEGMEALIEVLFNALELHPRGIRHLCLVPMSKPPSRKTRKLMAWAANKLGPRLIACAWAADDTMMSLVAPIMNACMFVGGAPLNSRFFGDATQAADWLAQFGALEPARISAHVQFMHRSR